MSKKYTREELLDFLKTLRDEMLTRKTPIRSAEWLAERADSIIGILALALDEEVEEA